MDSEYDQFDEYQLFQQQQFVHFSFRAKNFEKRNYECKTRLNSTKTYINGSQTTRQLFSVLSTTVTTSITLLYNLTTIPLTTKTIPITKTNTPSSSFANYNANSVCNININRRRNSNLLKSNNTNNTNNNNDNKNYKNGKNFNKGLRNFSNCIPYYFLVYVSLLLWLNVKSSVAVIAGSSINYKEHYGTLNSTLNNTLLHLRGIYNNGNNSNNSQSQTSHKTIVNRTQHDNRTTDVLIGGSRTSSISSSLPPIIWLGSKPSLSTHINSFATVTAYVLNDSTISGIDTVWELPSIQTICVSIILLLIILVTIVGNILVCIAVCMVRKLRRPCNYLLVSLALSDLCVAVLVMPIALLNEVFEQWNFGPVLCDIWVSFDVLCCTASILNLCAISVDRYLAITKPLEYGVKRTPRRMMICVALVWLAAACISLPPLLILGNEHIDEKGMPTCTVCQNFAYQIYATLGSFYIPLAVMLFVYYQIFRAARRIVLEEKRAQTHLQHALNGTGSSPPIHTELDYTTDCRNSGGGSSGQQQQHRHSSYGNTSLNYGGAIAIAGQRGGGSGTSGLLGSPHHKKLRFQLAKEKKASTTLGIIMSAFTICWLPFFILALIRPFIESESVHVPQTLSSLFLWLGYANSLLNPIIYATLNRDFRKPFHEILYFRCSSLNTMMRENYYQDQYGEPPSQRVMLGDERHGARESFL